MIDARPEPGWILPSERQEPQSRTFMRLEETRQLLFAARAKLTQAGVRARNLEDDNIRFQRELRELREAR